MSKKKKYVIIGYILKSITINNYEMNKYEMKINYFCNGIITIYEYEINIYKMNNCKVHFEK